MEKICKYRHLVMPGDLNPANCLFGGQMLKWLDEAAALYAMCKLNTNRLVTLKMSEILFKFPVKQGDVVEFYTGVKAAGRTSFTIEVTVVHVDMVTKAAKDVLTAEVVMVTVDENGKSVPHGYAGEIL